MILQPVVEGQGDEAAVPVLLRRLVEAAQRWEVQIARPHRRKWSELVQKDSLQAAVQTAILRSGCAGVLIVFDADDECPKDLGTSLTTWAQEAGGHIPCAVVLAMREYEAWLLAGIQSLRGISHVRVDADIHPNPEAPRDAKGEMARRMEPRYGYLPTVDQAPLTANFDLVAAYRTCRSFRKLVKTFGALLSVAGTPPRVWPPLEWPAPDGSPADR
jgi:hypothetical protein